MPDAHARAIPQLRHALRALLPPWLKRTVGDSFLAEGMFTVYDVDAAYMRAALLLRFPTYAPESALPLIAADRGVPMGVDEPVDVLRRRLILWLDVQQLAGLALGLLIASQAAIGPAYNRVRVVTQGSIWSTLEDGAVPRLLGLEGYAPLPLAPYESGVFWPIGQEADRIERLRLSGLYTRVEGVNNWDWDSLSPVHGTGYPAATWLILYSQPPNDWVEPDDMWGTDGAWGDGGAWGVTISPALGKLLQAIAAKYKSARSWVRYIIVCFEGSLDPVLFDPDQPSGGDINPDGLFGRWSKVVPGTGWVRSRFERARYGGGAL